MTLPSSRVFVVGGVWLATAVVAYSVGWMASPASVTVAAPGTPSAAPAADSAQDASAATLLRYVQEEKSSGVVQTTQAITGGQPVDVWLKNLFDQEDEILRTAGFMQLLATLGTPEAIQEALLAIQNMGGRDGGRRGWDRGSFSREYGMLLQKWAQMDPKGAAAYAVKAGSRDEEKAMNTARVLRTWARGDVEAALGWATTEGAVPGAEDNWAIAAVLPQIAKTDLERAMRLANEQPFGRARGRMADTLVDEMVKQRGEEGARTAAESMPPGAFRDGVLAIVAGKMAEKDGPQTADWVMQMPAGDGRGRALAVTVEKWAKSNVVEAGKFLARLPASPETDGSRMIYAGEVLSADPEGAMAWSSTITSEDQRNRTKGRLLQRWKAGDAAAADKWIAANPQPEEVVRRMGRN